MGGEKRFVSELSITLVLADKALKMSQIEESNIVEKNSAVEAKSHENSDIVVSSEQTEKPSDIDYSAGQHAIENKSEDMRSTEMMADKDETSNEKMAVVKAEVNSASNDDNVASENSAKMQISGGGQQMSLQQLCRDIQITFKENSLGMQKTLGNIDTRMSQLERMQFLIRKQSHEMLNLKLRIAEAESKYQHDHNQLLSYRRKIKELNQKISEMQLKDEVRERTEREVERRESRRSDQMMMMMNMSRSNDRDRSPQVITVPQPYPVIMGLSPTGVNNTATTPPLQQQQQQQWYPGTQANANYGYSGDMNGITGNTTAMLPAPSSPVITELPDQPTGNTGQLSRKQSVVSVKSVHSRIN